MRIRTLKMLMGPGGGCRLKPGVCVCVSLKNSKLEDLPSLEAGKRGASIGVLGWGWRAGGSGLSLSLLQAELGV